MIGASPVSSYALHGVAAVQVVLEAVKHSDGTRAGVRNAVFSGRGVTVGVAISVLGRAFSIDRRTGDVTLKDVTLKDVTVEVVRNSREQLFSTVTVK
jgi:branched-chain amino acid transport system substrate-binding protein